MQNPYEAPETSSPISKQEVREHSKPMIPAVIGMFTYGSSSPYALVLCMEHYFDPSMRPKPWSTHIAALLATIGSLVWIAFNLVLCSDTMNLLLGKPTSSYAQIGLVTWLATLVFFAWTFWRINRFMQRGIRH